MKEKIEKWFLQGLWTAGMVRNAIGKVLTGPEAEAIINLKEVNK